MKKIFTKNSIILSILLFFCIAGKVNAQENGTETAGKNLVKWNVGAIFLNNYSFQYERAIAPKISVALGLRFSPKSSLPFKSSIEKSIDNDDTWNNIKDFKTGNFALTPEVRFYLGKGGFRGFYIAPFVRYATYSAEGPFTFDVNVAGTTRTETMPLSGDITALTGGVLFGAQWKLSKLVYLDWWILGPNYGTSSGSISGKKSLNSDEQAALRDALTDLDDLPLVKTKYTVDNEGAKVDFDGPWAGLRGGLSIGFRF
ncbi:DUF3575 domain-containing protein [Pedobacter heparinus]|uniref:DUF3575 domain-containing protein n=1 Tax=Pedobacter heparinus (strain ATCC 13125 / DSM 2366 / CIP 104194 / JCM 7457 / NBRC 12017 / NCIMB 9290 / NRRL B-14731 / HIM 762-3) TaxID=485917 RepID=C6XVJ0_PEDHD|nr:DUF3575 domain-containing protein [Pedobacter heparinus]ACU04056.1 hypothetical protein Phep_1848 [Pedobacter heparinus DSM 2366]